MKKADLHIHTTASDGKFTPKEVVDLAIKRKLDAISITDHDTTSGIQQAINQSKKYNSLEVIPGIELSSEHNGEEIHILGYYIDYKSSLLEDVTNKLKKLRIERAYKILKKLELISISIDTDKIENIIAENNYIGRPHIAKLLIDEGYVNSMEEAFDSYLGFGKKGYVPREKLSLEDSINLITKIGGYAVLAHPGLIKQNLEPILRKFKFQGIEIYHTKHTDMVIEKLNILARRFNLIKTGGSDCHGNITPILGNTYIQYQNNIFK
ncbi:MAG: PHP domain-containing protein [Firmicutes bacterium]|nr:PHP domain-containing protein [Bacillota bacterium]